MNKTILAGFLILSSLWSKAQMLTVYDVEKRQPLELVSVFSESPRAFARTNSHGEVDISSMKGFVKIEIQIFGYAPVKTSWAELESANFKVYLELSPFSLNEVVTSASRWRQTSDNVPAKIISISPKEIAAMNPQTAADMLTISGAVYIQKSQQGGGSPMIRGFATNRLLYSVDGVRMNTAIFRGGNLQNVINLDPFATENTEILFGPGSVIYGSDAIGGVMNFQTLSPQLSLTDKPLVSGSSTFRTSTANQEKTAHVHLNLGGKKWASVTSFSTWTFEHLRQGSKGPIDYIKPIFVVPTDSIDVAVHQTDSLLQIPTAYSQKNFMQKLKFQPNKQWSFDYGFHYSETSSYGRYDRHNRMRNDLPRYAEWNYGPQIWMMNNFSVHHTLPTMAYDELTLRMAQQHFEESRISRSFNKSVRSTQTEKVEAYSVNFDLNKSIGAKHTIFYGTEFISNLVRSTGSLLDLSTQTTLGGPSRYPEASWNSMAVYVHDEFHLSSKTTVQSGLRYNQYALNAKFDTSYYPLPFTLAKLNYGSLTGSIGAVFRPGSTWVISTQFGTAFRSPNVDDMGKVFDSEPGSVVVPNPDLKAEYAYNLDANIAKTFWGKLRLDISGYYTLLQNAMVRRDYALNGQDSMMYDGTMSKIQAIQNAANASVYGIQLGLEIKLPAGLGFNSHFNLQKGTEEMDNGEVSPSRHAAPIFGSSQLSYKHKKLQILFYLNYQGERSYNELAVEERTKDEIYAKDANGKNYAPAWHTLNLKASYELDQNMTVSLGIENISDQRYRTYSSGISGAGRNVIFSMRANF